MPVADAHRKADHWHIDETGDNRRQRAVHPRRDDDAVDIPRDDVPQRLHESMQPRHTHVGRPGDLDAHLRGHQRRLVGDRAVRAAGRDHGNAAPGRRDAGIGSADDGGAGDLVPLDVETVLGEVGEDTPLIVAQAGDEDATVRVEQPADGRGEIVWALVGGENDFGDAGAAGTVGIDAHDRAVSGGIGAVAVAPERLGDVDERIPHACCLPG